MLLPLALSADEGSTFLGQESNAQHFGSSGDCPDDDNPIAGGTAEEATCDTAAAIEIVGLEDALSRGNEDAFTIEGGVPPFTITLNSEGGRGFSLAQTGSNFSIRSNVLKVADDACGGAEIEMTDSCNIHQSFFVRCVDAGQWVFLRDTEHGCCDLYGRTPTKFSVWASGKSSITTEGNRKLTVEWYLTNADTGDLTWEEHCQMLKNNSKKYACGQNATPSQIGYGDCRGWHNPDVCFDVMPGCVALGFSDMVIQCTTNFGGGANPICERWQCED